MKRSFMALVMFLAAVGAVLVPSAAQGAPPFDCKAKVVQGMAEAWCLGGTGSVRALALCQDDYGERVWFPGDWVNVKAGYVAYEICYRSGYLYILAADYETRPY